MVDHLLNRKTNCTSLFICRVIFITNNNPWSLRTQICKKKVHAKLYILDTAYHMHSASPFSKAKQIAFHDSCHMIYISLSNPWSLRTHTGKKKVYVKTLYSWYSISLLDTSTVCYFEGWYDWFLLQVKQKQGESASDKQKHRTAGGDTDSIRAAILEESVIVCKSNCLESGI